MGLNRRQYLATFGTTASSLAVAGCSGDNSNPSSDQDNTGGNNTSGSNTNTSGSNTNTSGSNTNNNADFRVVYNYKRYETLTIPGNEGVSYSSDNEEQYVGVQIKVTNTEDEELSLGSTELWILADGSSEDVSIHAQSETGPLESISPDETVETWLMFTVPTGSELEFDESQWAEHSFDLSQDESLEIALNEVEE